VQVTPQFDLFAGGAARASEIGRDLADAEPNHAAVAIAAELAAMDPDALTPREALAALYQLKQLANQ